MKLFAASLLLASGASVVSAKVDYEGAQAIRISPGEDVAALHNIIQELSLPTWKGFKGGRILPNKDVDLVVPVDKLDAFVNATSSMDTHVMHENLAHSMAAEVSESYAGSPTVSWFNAYHAYADHLQFLSDLVTANPNNAAIVTAGNSLNGRPITGIHFYGSAGAGVKPAVVLHGTVHAREWITTLTTEYFAWNLLSNYSSNAEIKSFVDKYDFYIFPVVNPDGFVYTQTDDRLWRKNRQTTSGSSCLGHDINRNWPYQWSVSAGASTDPCAEDFRGSTASDAPETKVLAAYNDKIAKAQGIQLYIDLHSYSQLFMTPFGYSCSATVNNNSVLQSLAKGVAVAIQKVYGTTYQYGPICTTIYPASGNSVDYAAEVTGSKYTFTIELRDTGDYGFILPAKQILPTVLETWAGLRYLLLNMT